MKGVRSDYHISSFALSPDSHSHFRQLPNQPSSIQWHGSREGDVSGAGEGSRQIKPNQAGEVHVCWHSVEGFEVVVLGGVAVVAVVVGSRHPNQPGSWHELVEVVDVDVVECSVVSIGGGVGVGPVDVAAVVVVGSLHPNQPGVLQVEVEVVEISEVVVEPIDVVVVVSSTQPHHPRVLQVDVVFFVF
jgi:hypothetical protein